MVYMVKLSRHVGCLCDPKSRKRAEDCGKAGRGGGLGLRRAAEFEYRTDAFGELGTAIIAPCPIRILPLGSSFLLFAFLALYHHIHGRRGSGVPFSGHAGANVLQMVCKLVDLRPTSSNLIFILFFSSMLLQVKYQT